VGQAQIRVRAATAQDAAVVADIGASSFRDAYAPHSEPPDLEAHLRDYFTPDAVRACIECDASRYLLATVDGEPGGIAKYRAAACPVPGGATDALELQQLYVLASQQRHGLGRHLLHAVTEIAGRQRLAGIWLSVWEDAHWALNFYEKNGFMRVGTADFAVGATNYRDLLLWLPVPEAMQKNASRSRS
jgi:ribosomal protein S18 acetylase RimI-like enzyme